MTEEFKGVTIDELAIMMNNSFEDLKTTFNAKIDGFRAETKAEFIDVHEQLDRIEDVMIRDDRKRIERLEDKMLQVQVILKTQL